MKLAEVFAVMGPLLEGRATVEEAGRALWPRGAPKPSDAERLAIYARFCRNHRFATLDHIYADCRRVVVEAAGPAAWEQLVEAYFRAHPAHHVELNHNGDALPAFLAEYTPTAFLPGYIHELADLEWWQWLTRSAPDCDSDHDDHPATSETPALSTLRLASTVELRTYRWDFVAWAEQPWPRPPPIEQDQPVFVLYWRDRDLAARRETTSPIELAALKLVAERLSLDQAVAAGLDRAALTEALADLHAAGILRG